jgi:hypothetical protein
MCNCLFTCWRTAEEIFLCAISLRRCASITVGVTEHITATSRQHEQHNKDNKHTTTETDETIGVLIDKQKTGARVELWTNKQEKRMSQLLQTLKLTSARKQRALPEVVKRRNKMLKKLTEQRELALAIAEGRLYAPKRLRTVVDGETGQKTVREMPVRIKAWWWTGEKGETLLSLFYGSKTLELSKGKTAVEIASLMEVPNVLEVIINAVQNSELDAQIEAASVKLREGFKADKTVKAAK